MIRIHQLIGSVWTPNYVFISDNLPHIPWAFEMCELTGMVLLTVWLTVCILHKHRYVNCNCKPSIDPRGRSTVGTHGHYDHCFCTCRPFVSTSACPSIPAIQNKTNFKRKQCSLLARLQSSGRVDHWWHLSCSLLSLQVFLLVVIWASSAEEKHSSTLVKIDFREKIVFALEHLYYSFYMLLQFSNVFNLFIQRMSVRFVALTQKYFYCNSFFWSFMMLKSLWLWLMTRGFSCVHSWQLQRKTQSHKCCTELNARLCSALPRQSGCLFWMSTAHNSRVWLCLFCCEISCA